MDEYPGVRKSTPLSLLPGSQKQGPDARRLSHTQGRNFGLDILHGIVYRQASSYQTPGGIDIDINILVRILRFQKEHLGDQHICHIIIDERPDEDNSLLEKTGVNVIRPLHPPIFFDNDWN